MTAPDCMSTAVITGSHRQVGVYGVISPTPFEETTRLGHHHPRRGTPYPLHIRSIVPKRRLRIQQAAKPWHIIIANVLMHTQGSTTTCRSITRLLLVHDTSVRIWGFRVSFRASFVLRFFSHCVRRFSASQRFIARWV